MDSKRNLRDRANIKKPVLYTPSTKRSEIKDDISVVDDNECDSHSVSESHLDSEEYESDFVVDDDEELEVELESSEEEYQDSEED